MLRGEKHPMDQTMAMELGRTLMMFDSEDQKQSRLDMAYQLHQSILEHKLKMTEQLFDSLVYVFTESQEWSTVS